jgi:hypothetical protein
MHRRRAQVTPALSDTSSGEQLARFAERLDGRAFGHAFAPNGPVPDRRGAIE